MTMMTPPPLDQEDDEMLVPHSEFNDNAQPMEGVVVAQGETVSTAENQPVEDPPTSRFTWTIENFSRLNSKKHYSDIFVVGGYKWRVLIFPKGNNVDHLSMYLDVADSATLPYGWSRYAQFCLSVVNQLNSKYTIRKDTQHQFNARESDWGFTSFMPLSDLYDPNKGYLVNDTVVVEAEVAVRRVVDYWTYDSKKETGYVGLKNQGATCYMNSLLQTLYHIPYFRKAVYHMPTTENDMPSGSIPLALQSLFYKLQYSDNSVATKELTKSFGWDTYDSFMQHDVQELNRVLCEKLEDKMKGTVVEGTIQQLFEGHHMNYIECINVDYKSTRKESFYDLQLDVKGCRDVYASFDKYVEVERLEGDNKYHAEQHGLQDARKGVLFIDFPPVLQLQLKRFEYDFMRDTMVKINDRYEFPLQLDLDRENGKYLSPDADRSVRNLYTLHSVLVHSGGVHGGHYYAFIRPTLSDQWFKFDDERVTKEDMKRALEEQYGGEEELPQNPGFNNTPFKFTKYSNAYMLVYIRESDKEKVICNVDEKDIAEHLRIRLKKEQEEKEHKKKEKAEAHLYTIIKVAKNEDLAEQIGKDIYFDLVDHDKVRSFRIQKQMPFSVFKEEVAKEFGVPVQFQRFWLWAKRQNHTYRPNRPLTHQEETQSVGQLREVSNKAHNAELRLFLEVEFGPDLRPILPPEKTKEDILLFFKLYDPEKEELRYVGRLFVKSSGKPIEILTKLNEMAGFPPNEEIELYEEIKFEPNVMCEHIDKKLAFRASQLEDGDIICFQKALSAENDERFRYPDVPSFLDYVHNRQVVHFRSLERPKEDDFCLELSKLYTYDDVVERVARQLGLDDPTKIRLTSHNCYSQQPKPQPIKYRGVERLSDMLVHYNQTSDILYYEVLDIPLPELQGLKTLKVAFHHSTKDEVVSHSIRLPKQSTVGDVINDLKTKVELSNSSAELRLLEVFYHKIYKIFPLGEKIENINDQYWTLRAEEIPEEEKNLSPHDRLIHVYHFTKDTTQNQMQVQNFGEPFFLVIREGETLAEVKVRIQKKLQVPDEEFSKWKFAFLSLGRPEYLQDSDVVSTRFQRRDVYGAWEQYLGLEHSDSAPKRSYTANQEKESQNSTCQTVKVVEISADNNTSRVTWKIENFSSLDTEKHLSDIFNIGGCKWQLLIYPKGNNVDGLSVYLNVPDAGSLPNGWSRKANVCFCIINQTNGNDSIRKDTIHVFNARETDWGFTSFIPLSDLCPKKGYMLNDTIIVEVEVSVSNVINYSTDSTKTESASKSDMEVILEHEEELQVKNPIRELNKEIKSLQAAKEIVEIHLKSFKQELALKDLAHRVRELELQANNPKVEEPKSEIKSLQEAIVTFDEEFQGFTKELTVKNAAHHACEMEPHFNNSEIEELKSEIKSLKEAKATVEEELIECKKELVMQEEACHSLELKLQADTPIVAELTNQIENLQDAKSVVEEELKACREELVTRIEAHHARESEFKAKAAKIEELTKAMKIVVTVKAMVDEELKASKQELAIKDTACHDRELELQTSNSKIEELKNEIKSLQDAKQKVEEELKGYQRELEMGDMKARFKDLEYELAIAKKDGEIKELLASLKFSEKRVQDVKEAAADWRFLTFSASGLEGAQM